MDVIIVYSNVKLYKVYLIAVDIADDLEWYLKVISASGVVLRANIPKTWHM